MPDREDMVRAGGAVIVAPGDESVLKSAEILAKFIARRDDMKLGAGYSLDRRDIIARYDAAETAKILIQVVGPGTGPGGGVQSHAATDLRAFEQALAQRSAKRLPPLRLHGVFAMRAEHARSAHADPAQAQFLHELRGDRARLQAAEFADDAILLERAAAWIYTKFLLVQRLTLWPASFARPITDSPEIKPMAAGEIVRRWTEL